MNKLNFVIFAVQVLFKLFGIKSHFFSSDALISSVHLTRYFVLIH